MALARKRSQAYPSVLLARSLSGASISMSKIFPCRTPITPSIASDRSPPSIALPCGSTMPYFSVALTLAFKRSASASGGVRGRRHGEQRVKRRGLARCAQLRRRRRVAQEPRAHGQGFQMVGAGRFGRDQQEDEVHRQPVGRIEVDRPVETGEHAENLLTLGELSVRNGDPVADASRTQALPLQDRVEDLARRQTRDVRGALAQFLQRLLLAIDAQRRDDRVRLDQLR